MQWWSGLFIVGRTESDPTGPSRQPPCNPNGPAFVAKNCINNIHMVHITFFGAGFRPSYASVPLKKPKRYTGLERNWNGNELYGITAWLYTRPYIYSSVVSVSLARLEAAVASLPSEMRSPLTKRLKTYFVSHSRRVLLGSCDDACRDRLTVSVLCPGTEISRIDGTRMLYTTSNTHFGV
jgi:hypothetical protein